MSVNCTETDRCPPPRAEMALFNRLPRIVRDQLNRGVGCYGARRALDLIEKQRMTPAQAVATLQGWDRDLVDRRRRARAARTGIYGAVGPAHRARLDQLVHDRGGVDEEARPPG